MYRYTCNSVEGFVQQLAVGYVARGCWFYVTGRVPAGKDPEAVDAKLIERYGIGISKWARARHKRAGAASVRYLRHGRFFVLIATRGRHRFFQEEGKVRDIREDPIKFHRYSIGCGKGSDGKWHASVRIHAEEYKNFKAYFLGLAAHRSVENLAAEFRSLRLIPFARVRRQLLNILRAVNRARKIAGLEPVPASVLLLRRSVVRPFGSAQRKVA